MAIASEVVERSLPFCITLVWRLTMLHRWVVFNWKSIKRNSCCRLNALCCFCTFDLIGTRSIMQLNFKKDDKVSSLCLLEKMKVEATTLRQRLRRLTSLSSAALSSSLLPHTTFSLLLSSDRHRRSRKFLCFSKRTCVDGNLWSHWDRKRVRSACIRCKSKSEKE